MNQDEFRMHFYAECAQLSESLNQLSDGDAAAGAAIDKLTLSTKYEAISARTDLLNKYFAQHSPSMPLYEVRKAQEQLTKLQRLAQERRDTLFPKKKFGFRSKQNMTTLESAIAVAATAATKTTVESDNTTTPDDTAGTTVAASNTANSCTLSELRDADVTMSDADIRGKDVTVVNVRNSVIRLRGVPSVLHVSDVRDTLILCGPTVGSAFVANCVNCRLVVAAHQLRIHDTHNTEFYINVASRAIIENSDGVAFAPYAWRYPLVDEHFAASAIKCDPVNWTSIDDFNWLSQSKKSPNWHFLDESQRSSWTD